MKPIAWLGPALPFAAITSTALAMPAWRGTEPLISMTAGAMVALGTGATLCLCRGWRRDRWGAMAFAAGLCLLALALAGPFLPGLQTWVFPAAALVALAPLTGGIQRSWRRWQETQSELESLRSRLTRREGDVAAQADRIRRLDLFDPITHLLNRRGFMVNLDRALAEGAAVHEAMTMVLLECHPPRNDQDRGGFDRWMTELGQAVQSAVRSSDFAGRLDDHLVALLLPRCRDHRPAVQRLHQALVRHQRQFGGSFFLAGVAAGPQDLWPDGPGLLAAAEAALAAARQGPRAGQAPVWPVAWAMGSSGNRTGNLVQ